MKARLAAGAAASVTIASLLLAAVSLGAAGTTLLVSGSNETGTSSFPATDTNPAISGNGDFVAFVRSADETGSGVYLRNMHGGTVAVDVPKGTSVQGIDLAAGSPSLSADGRYLAFASEDPGISSEDRDSETTPAGDTYPVRDIFVYDRANGATSLVSRASGVRGYGGSEDSNLPAISADGRYVAFQTEATNLLHGSYGGIFVRDLHRRTTTPVASLRLHPGGRFNGGFTPSISAHGRWVAFLTEAHLRHGHALEVAVRDMKRERTVYVSRASGGDGALANGDCKLPAISANGRFVAFVSKASNLDRGGDAGIEDVFVRDLRTDRTRLVSRAQGRHGAAGNGDSSNPAISAGGRYVAFESDASNLGPHDDPAISDVFVRDLRSGRVFLASRAGNGGAAANAPSANPSMSADGHYVAFDSRGTNLAAADTLHANSVFRYQLLP